MSETYGLACHRCRVFVWIGQKGWDSDGCLYGTPESQTLQRDFLFSHVGHPLGFGLTSYFYGEREYEEISGPMTEQAEEGR